MKAKNVSPDTPKGSFSRDLIIRKLWALDELSKIEDKFQSVYILGSWYGNMGFILDKTSDISFDKLFNVDIDKETLDSSEKIYSMAEIKNVRFVHLDANKLKYRNAKSPNLVINTSINNIKGDQWFKNIPPGSLVLLQSRNNDLGSVNEIDNIKDLKRSFPLKKILYAGTIDLSASEADYESFMIIGIK